MEEMRGLVSELKLSRNAETGASPAPTMRVFSVSTARSPLRPTSNQGYSSSSRIDA